MITKNDRGVPVLEGAKVRVLQIHDLVLRSDMPPEVISRAYADVSEGIVHVALDYHSENSEEMKRLREERTRAEQRLEDRSINND